MREKKKGHTGNGAKCCWLQDTCKRIANTPTLAGYATTTRMHRCLIRANSYYQQLEQQKHIINTYLYFEYK